MKKSVVLLALMVLVVSLTGCTSKDVELSFSDFQAMRSFGELTDEVIEGIKKEDGVKNVVKKDDGSLVITMDKDKHEELMEGLKKELDNLIEYTETASDFKFIDRIEASDDYSKIDIFVDKGELEVLKASDKTMENILEALSFSFGSVVSTYKAYANTGDKIELNYIDNKTKKEIEKIVFPDFIEDLVKEEKEDKPVDKEVNKKEDKKEDK